MTTLTLEALSDRQEIVDLLVSYTSALDGRDWTRLNDVFVPTVVADFGDLHCEGLDAVTETCRRALSGLTTSQHLIGNFAITVDDDRASSACYVRAMHYYAQATGLKTFVVAGIYRDALTRTNEGWRIERRTLEKTWEDGNAGLMAESAARMKAESNVG